MTTQSICFAGLSRDEQAGIEAAFRQANAQHGNRWSLANENEAAVVVVDMDSMYGQMSLMKALSNGKVVVALTAGGRVDADYQLARPVTAEGIVALLSQIEAQAPATPAPALRYAFDRFGISPALERHFAATGETTAHRKAVGLHVLHRLDVGPALRHPTPPPIGRRCARWFDEQGQVSRSDQTCKRSSNSFRSARIVPRGGQEFLQRGGFGPTPQRSSNVKRPCPSGAHARGRHKSTMSYCSGDMVGSACKEMGLPMKSLRPAR